MAEQKRDYYEVLGLAKGADENEIKKAQNNVLYHSFAYKTLKNLAEKNGGKIETSLSDDRLAITTGWVINNFS